MKKTIEYCKNRQFVPSGEMFEQAVDYWRTLVPVMPDAVFDKEVKINAGNSATGFLGYFAGDGGSSHWQCSTCR